jgi:hypothetical protein
MLSITVMWAIWTSGNNRVHDKGSLDPVQSMKLTREMLSLLDVPRQHAAILLGHGWRPPEPHWVKINTDAGISFDARMGELGGRKRSFRLHRGMEQAISGSNTPIDC